MYYADDHDQWDGELNKNKEQKQKTKNKNKKKSNLEIYKF